MPASPASAKEKIIFVDRDGVINVDPIGDYIKSWKDFRFETGALEGLKKLSDAGLGIIIISNQAGIGDGVYPESNLRDIHARMLKAFKEAGIQIKGSHYCLHGKNAGCKCRKPETGLFEAAVQGLSYDPRKTFFIGDKATDVEAGKRFGIRTLFVRTGHGAHDEPVLASRKLIPDFRAADLREAADIAIKNS